MIENNNIELNDEITLEDLINFLERSKKFLFLFSFLGILLGAINAYTAKKIWKGEFEIVLEDNKTNNSNLVSNPLFNSILNNRNFEIKTEVEKLKSPLVLMDVFKFVQEKDKYKDLSFNSWRKALDIELRPGTQVLDLSYKDSNKELILPVLTKISDTYQKYSGMKRMRDLDNEINHVEEQITIYKEKSFNSISETQDFASEQDLRIVNNEFLNDEPIEKKSDKVNFFTSIEFLRVEAANNIKIIKQQIEKIKTINPSSDEIIYLAKNLKGIDIDTILESISEVDLNLSEAKVFLKDNDDSIKNLNTQRSNLISILFTKSQGYLLAKLEDNKRLLETYQRPKGVLKKYRQLLNDSVKNKLTLDNLEDGYRNLLLEKAKIKDPWELISEPNLLPNPVSPNKKLRILIGAIVGFFIGVFGKFILDKKENFIYTSLAINKILSIPIDIKLNLLEKDDWEETISLLINNSKIKSDNSIFIYNLGNLHETDIYLKIKDSFTQKSNKKKIVFTSNLLEVKNFENFILLIKLGNVKTSDLYQFKNKLSLINKQVKFLVLID